MFKVLWVLDIPQKGFPREAFFMVRLVDSDSDSDKLPSVGEIALLWPEQITGTKAQISRYHINPHRLRAHKQSLGRCADCLFGQYSLR